MSDYDPNTTKDRFDLQVDLFRQINKQINDLINETRDVRERVIVIEAQNFKEKMENQGAEVTDNIVTVHSRIDAIENKVIEYIEKGNDKLLAELEKHSQQSRQKEEKLEKRITALEKWFWAFTGMAMLVSLVIGASEGFIARLVGM